MPILDYKDKKIKIPFTPKGIANLLYQGYTVYPESGLDPQVLKTKRF